MADIRKVQGKSVRELVLEKNLLTEEELETVLNPYLMTEIGEDRKNGKKIRKIG